LDRSEAIATEAPSVGENTAGGGNGRENLIARFRKVRDFSARLCQGLQPEDYVVQSMPDVSPTK